MLSSAQGGLHGAIPEPLPGAGARANPRGEWAEPGAQRSPRALPPSAGTLTLSPLPAGSASRSTCGAAGSPSLGRQGNLELPARLLPGVPRVPAPATSSNALSPSLPSRAPRISKESQCQLPGHGRVSGSPSPGVGAAGCCEQGVPLLGECPVPVWECQAPRAASSGALAPLAPVAEPCLHPEPVLEAEAALCPHLTTLLPALGGSSGAQPCGEPGGRAVTPPGTGDAAQPHPRGRSGRKGPQTTLLMTLMRLQGGSGALHRGSCPGSAACGAGQQLPRLPPP